MPKGRPIANSALPDATDRAILDAARRLDRAGTYPSVREIEGATGIPYPTVAWRIRRLNRIALWTHDRKVNRRELSPSDRGLLIALIAKFPGVELVRMEFQERTGRTVAVKTVQMYRGGYRPRRTGEFAAREGSDILSIAHKVRADRRERTA